MFKEVSALFHTPLRIKVLTFFLRREGSWGTVTEVASTLSAPRTPIQKELSALARLGILKSRKSKRTASYSVNDKHELVMSLRSFVASACIPSDKAIAQVFRKERGVTLVVASGFLVTGSKSPIELLIVSKKPDVKQIEKAVKKVEALAALPLRYAILEAHSYEERRQSYDRLLRDVFEYPHRIVLEKAW